MANEVRLTQEGFDRLKAELEQLKGAERLKVAEAIREAKSHGDLRENAAYHEAKLNQARLEQRIAELEKAVQVAKVVEAPESGAEGAQIGSSVTLIDLEFDDEFVVKLVGSFEADATQGHISITSPLGEALLGKSEGAEVEITAPGGVSRYRVQTVSA